jgi:hypothetical protein
MRSEPVRTRLKIENLSELQLINFIMNIPGMANPMSQMNSYYPNAAAAYSSLSAASMAAAAAAAAAQQNAIAGLANSNSQQVKIPPQKKKQAYLMPTNPFSFLLLDYGKSKAKMNDLLV